MYSSNGTEYVSSLQFERLALSPQFMGKNIEENLRIRLGVDMTEVLTIELFHQLIGVNQVSVVRKADPIGALT